MAFSDHVRTGMTKRRWSALCVGVLWVCAWLMPLVHETQCAEHHHGAATCPICQFAATSVIETPAQTAPEPVFIVVQHQHLVWTLSPALLFQVEHPPRGPPPAVACV